MNRSIRSLILGLGMCFILSACASADIPQAYRGRVFARTGALAFYGGNTGFIGPVLGPGTYFTGTYNELRLVDCSMVTVREPLTALTRDGVQFGLDIYVRFAAACDDQAVDRVLTALSPDKDNAVSVNKLYETYVRPAISEAIRQAVSPYRANDINDKREELIGKFRKRFVELMTAQGKGVVNVHEVNLSNMDFPDAMDAANVDRAVQGVLRDKAIAERERVTAEIETARMRQALSETEAASVVIRIERIGAALRQYSEYLQYDLQDKLPKIYETAGANGNLVLAAPNPVSIPQRSPASLPAASSTPKPRQSGNGPTFQTTNPVTSH